MSNKNLKKAKVAKIDEFYTPMEIIKHELCYYKDQFKDKIIYCNCDDLLESNFFRYFVLNFKNFQLKKLITTSYKKKGISSKYEITEDMIKDYTGDKSFRLEDVLALVQENPHCETALKGNGDFRSEECIEILKTVDIVITNPPFSLFRAYLKQLMDYNKKFLIIGNTNLPLNLEVFPLFKNNKIKFGISNKNMYFYVPENSQKYDGYKNGRKIQKMPAAWYTNLDTNKWLKKLVLTKSYKRHPYLYPKYANIHWEGEPIIFVDKIKNIPNDYYGVMGVPQSILNNFDISDFEILSLSGGKGNKNFENLNKKRLKTYKNGVDTGKYVSPWLITGYIEYDKKRDKKDTLYLDEKTGKKYFKPYARVLIRRKNNNEL